MRAGQRGLAADSSCGYSAAKGVERDRQRPPAFSQTCCVSTGVPRARDRAGLVAGWANLRSRMLGLPYGDQGLLVPRHTYQAAGGFPDQPLMEDVALVRALPKVTVLNTRAFTSAERYERAGWIRRGARNLWTLLRYFLGADPQALAQTYRR